MDEQNPSVPPHAQSRTCGGLTHENARHTTRFTVIGNHLAQHPRLSGLAIGLAVHIQSLPAGGTPDVEDLPEGIMRHPDVMVIAWTDLDTEASIDPRALIAAVEVVSQSSPDNDWVGKMRDYPLMGIPTYAVFDPRTGTGAVLTDIHATPDGPRYATRKDFVYGEDVTIAEWTIPTDNLPRYTEGASS